MEILLGSVTNAGTADAETFSLGVTDNISLGHYVLLSMVMVRGKLRRGRQTAFWLPG